MLSVTFLGTSAARPTVERNVSAMALMREGETLLFECGEGTQRQMMRYGVSFALSEIFFTHFHADHFLGVIGLIRTLGLQVRTEPMRLYGPKGAKKLLTQALQLGVERVPFEVEIVEVKAGEGVEGGGGAGRDGEDRKSTRLNSSHGYISYSVFCFEKKKILVNFKPRYDQRGRDSVEDRAAHQRDQRLGHRDPVSLRPGSPSARHAIQVPGATCNES